MREVTPVAETFSDDEEVSEEFVVARRRRDGVLNVDVLLLAVAVE